MAVRRWVRQIRMAWRARRHRQARLRREDAPVDIGARVAQGSQVDQGPAHHHSMCMRCPPLVCGSARCLFSRKRGEQSERSSRRAWRRPRPAGSRPAARLAIQDSQQLVAVQVTFHVTIVDERQVLVRRQTVPSASRQAVVRHHCCVDDRWRAAMTPAGSWPTFSPDWCDRVHAHERCAD